MCCLCHMLSIIQYLVFSCFCCCVVVVFSKARMLAAYQISNLCTTNMPHVDVLNYNNVAIYIYSKLNTPNIILFTPQECCHKNSNAY